MAGCWWLACVAAVTSLTLCTATLTTGRPFTQQELRNLQEAVLRTMEEKKFVQQRVDMLKMQKGELLGELDELNMTFDGLFEFSDTQDTRLNHFKDQIKELIHTGADKANNVSSTVSVSDRVAQATGSLQAFVASDLASTATERARQIGKLQLELEQAKSFLNKTLVQSEESCHTDINIVQGAAEDLKKLLNSKKCIFKEVTVYIDAHTGTGSEKVNVGSNFFKGQTPEISCGLCSLNSTLRVQHPRSFSYKHGYIDEREASGLAVDCKALNDRMIDVRVFDHSRGGGNRIVDATVQVVACSQSSVAGHMP